MGQADRPDLSLLAAVRALARRPAVVVTGVAALIRIALLIMSVEAAGDGPTRAVMGWHWHLTGHTSFYANWLPGHEILIGLAYRLLPEPMWAGRLLSLVTGIVAVPMLHRIADRLAGPEAAIIAAAALAVSPMHAALSVTSLSEAPALAALLAALLATFRLGERFDDAMAWASLVVAGVVGASIRFEFWLLLPVLVLHQLWASRSLGRAALVALALSPFPVIWAVARIEVGGIGGAYAGAVSGAAIVGASAVELTEAVPLFLRTLTGLMGLPLALAAGLGVILMGRGALIGPVGADRAAWLTLLVGLTLFLLKFTADRGAALWPRYLLTEAVLLLPAAGLAACSSHGRRWWRAGLAAVLLAGAPLTAWQARPELYLAWSIPEPTRALAAWVETELDPAQPILMTRIGWQSSYLMAMAKMAPERYRVISAWLDDAGLRAYALRWRPRLLITTERDRDLVRRLRTVTGLVPSGPPIARFGDLVVLPLQPAARAPPA